MLKKGEEGKEYQFLEPPPSDKVVLLHKTTVEIVSTEQQRRTLNFY